MQHVIIGNGSVGKHLAQSLVNRGLTVRVVSRSTKPQSPVNAAKGQWEHTVADMTDDNSARQAVQGASVVYNVAQVSYEQWATGLAPLFRGILTATERAGASLALADNLYMYGSGATMPLRESESQHPSGTKGKVRALLSQECLDAHLQGRLPVAVARASDFFGPGVMNSALGMSVFPAILSGKPANLMGNVDVPHSYTYIKDFAESLAVLGTTDGGFGRAWHVPNAPDVTPREIIGMIAAISGTRPRFRTMGRTLLRLIGLFSPFLREFGETLYQFEKPFLVDGSDFQTRFDFQPTPLDEALTATVRWYREQATHNQPALQSVTSI